MSKGGRARVCCVYLGALVVPGLCVCVRAGGVLIITFLPLWRAKPPRTTPSVRFTRIPWLTATPAAPAASAEKAYEEGGKLPREGEQERGRSRTPKARPRRVFLKCHLAPNRVLVEANKDPPTCATSQRHASSEENLRVKWWRTQGRRWLVIAELRQEGGREEMPQLRCRSRLPPNASSIAKIVNGVSRSPFQTQRPHKIRPRRVTQKLHMKSSFFILYCLDFSRWRWSRGGAFIFQSARKFFPCFVTKLRDVTWILCIAPRHIFLLLSSETIRLQHAAVLALAT